MNNSSWNKVKKPCPFSSQIGVDSAWPSREPKYLKESEIPRRKRNPCHVWPFPRSSSHLPLTLRWRPGTKSRSFELSIWSPLHPKLRYYTYPTKKHQYEPITRHLPSATHRTTTTTAEPTIIIRTNIRSQKAPPQLPSLWSLPKAKHRMPPRPDRCLEMPELQHFCP